VIAVNGVQTSVSVGTDFPQSTDGSATPFFHLVSLTLHTAKISIAQGSYASGAASLTLHEGKAVTLMNTADGTRYKLQLFPQGTAVTAPTTTATTATAVANTTPATTTPTVP
jgi:hypothetical protein